MASAMLREEYRILYDPNFKKQKEREAKRALACNKRRVKGGKENRDDRENPKKKMRTGKGMGTKELRPHLVFRKKNKEHGGGGGLVPEGNTNGGGEGDTVLVRKDVVNVFPIKKEKVEALLEHNGFFVVPLALLGCIAPKVMISSVRVKDLAKIAPRAVPTPASVNINTTVGPSPVNIAPKVGPSPMNIAPKVVPTTPVPMNIETIKETEEKEEVEQEQDEILDLLIDSSDILPDPDDW